MTHRAHDLDIDDLDGVNDLTTTIRAARAMDDDESWPDEDEFWSDDDFRDKEAVEAQPTVWRDLAGLLLKVAVIVVVFGLIFSFTHGVARNTDPDMAPTVKAGDLVMFYRLDKNYQVSDLVMVRYRGENQVRRVVAQAGDVVDITADGLVVNGALQQEPDIFQPTNRYADGIRLPVTVGPGQVFVLGDARDNATDSRVYGPVNAKDTLGKVIAVVKWRDL